MRVHPIFFILALIVFLPGCKKPCEEAVKKTLSCVEEKGLHTSLEDRRDLLVKICKPHEDEVKSCLKFKECTEFNRCMKEKISFKDTPPPRQGPASTEPEKTEPNP